MSKSNRMKTKLITFYERITFYKRKNREMLYTNIKLITFKWETIINLFLLSFNLSFIKHYVPRCILQMKQI